nr:protein FLX-like 1 [Tanacetum cinerariifolium]
MPRRNRKPSLLMKGRPHGGRPPIHEPPFGRNLGPRPHPALLEKTREAQIQMGHHRKIPPHPGIFEERLGVQHQDIQALLVDNQRLAATHVALKQELKATQHELQKNDHFARNILMEKDMQLRGLYKKSAKMEHDLHGVEGMRAELMQVHADVKELMATRQKLTAQVQAMTQDLGRANADLQQVPALKSEIGGLRQELQNARAVIKHEKKVHAENYEHANPNLGYNPNYGNPEANYVGNPYPKANYAANPYPVNYGMSSANQMNPVQPGVEAYPQYVP